MGGCFERITSRVQALGWLEKKEEERIRKILSFNRRFRLATLEQFLHTITAAVDWGRLHKLF